MPFTYSGTSSRREMRSAKRSIARRPFSLSPDARHARARSSWAFASRGRAFEDGSVVGVEPGALGQGRDGSLAGRKRGQEALGAFEADRGEIIAHPGSRKRAPQGLEIDLEILRRGDQEHVAARGPPQR